MSRPIESVLKAIINVIPEHYTNRPYIAKGLQEVIQDSRYTAPELMAMRWTQAANVLRGRMPFAGDTNGEEWEEKVYKIFGAQLDYRDFL